MQKNVIPWSGLGIAYACAVTGLGAWAVWVFSSAPEDPDWVAFVVILLLACATTSMKIQLPGGGRPISLSFLFTFAAITELPGSAAFFVALTALIFEIVGEQDYTLHRRRLAFDLGSLAIGVLCTSTVYNYLKAESLLQWSIAAWAAACVFYAVSSFTSALRIAFEERTHPLKVWQQRFFWTGPVYMLAPIGLGTVRLILEADSTLDSLLGLAAIFAGYAYAKIYFSRLHDQQDYDRELAEIRHRGIETLAAAIEAKDGSTAGHLQRVKLHAARLAETLGCSKEEIAILEMAAVLHDVGKVGVPDYILMKPGRLTDHEFREIANHTRVGAAIVESARFPENVSKIVLSHHEHWDGSGYPRGLRGEAIPRLARILTVVDCFDALITDRPYRPALSIDQAVDLMRQQRGRIFDPQILDAFLDEFPGVLSMLKQDLENEREAARRERKPEIQISQTWIEEGGEHGAALRKRSLQQLSRSPEKLAAFYEILDMLGADLRFEESLKECLRILRNAIPYEKGGIFVFEEEKYILLSADGIPEHCISRMTLPAEHGLVAHAAVARSPLAADALPSEAPGEKPPLYLDDAGSSIVAPLHEGDRLVGTMILCAAQPGALTQEHAASLELITRKLARTLLSSRAVQKVYLEAETDTVTKLPNARAAFRKLEDEIKRAQREGQTVGVLFMDVDSLKPVNDSYGHGAGDQLLVETARKLRDRLRTYDFAGRIGGDEFIAILPGISRDGLPGTIESLKRAVAENAVKVAEGVYAQTTISIGAALFPHDGTDAEELVYISDQRMYEDKERSRSSERRGQSKAALVTQGNPAP